MAKVLERLVNKGWAIVVGGARMEALVAMAKEAGIEVEVRHTDRGWLVELA